MQQSIYLLQKTNPRKRDKGTHPVSFILWLEAFVLFNFSNFQSTWPFFMLGSKSFIFCPDILELSGFFAQVCRTKNMSESVHVFQTVLSVVYTFESVIKFSCGPIQHLRFPCTSTDSRGYSVNKPIDLLNEGLSYDLDFCESEMTWPICKRAMTVETIKIQLK